MTALKAASIVVSKTRPVVAANEMMQTTNGAESLYLFNSATTVKWGHCYKLTLFLKWCLKMFAPNFSMIVKEMTELCPL